MMAEWRYYEGEDEPLSGCELMVNDFTIRVTPNRPPHGFDFYISIFQNGIINGRRETRDLAMIDAMNELIRWLRANLNDVAASPYP